VTVPDEIHAIPHPLSVASTSSTFPNLEFRADYDISGVRFLSGASDTYPYTRELTRITKEQLDTSITPGDQSLEGWWMRSQTDWSGGADQEYMEPISTDLVKRKFYKSAGVDVFSTPGSFLLLPKAVEIAREEGTIGRVTTTSHGYVYSLGEVLYHQSFDGFIVNAGQHFSSDITSLVMAGPYLVIGFTDEAVVQDEAGMKVSTISGFTGIPVMAWVKGRLIFMAGDKAWELPGLIDADIDLSDTETHVPVMDMKDSSWRFAGAASTPASILLAGHGLAGSAVLALTLDDSGSIPELNAPIEVAQFPISETLIGIATYLGTFLGILTDKGVRIGTVTNEGGVVYGPLIGSPPSTGTSHEISVFDRFMAYPVSDAGDGRGGIVVVDLGVADEDGRNSWANWTRIPSSSRVVDAVILDQREAALIALEPAAGGKTDVVLYQAREENGLESEGWLQTSWVRFGTLEGKYFDQLKVICESPMKGSVSVSVIDDAGVTLPVGVLTSNVGQEGTFKISGRHGYSSMAARFVLRPDEVDGSLAPTVSAWSFRAWPAVRNRGETVVLPLLCFDFERDSSGVQVGYEGYARERWEALMEQLTSGSAVRVREFSGGFAYMAVVDRALFLQVAPPAGASGFGGIAQITLRQA